MYIVVTGTITHEQELTEVQLFAAAEKNASRALLPSYNTQQLQLNTHFSNLSAEDASLSSNSSAASRRGAIIQRPSEKAEISRPKEIHKKIDFKIVVPPQTAEADCTTIEQVNEFFNKLEKSAIILHGNITVNTSKDTGEIVEQKVFIIQSDEMSKRRDSFLAAKKGPDISDLQGIVAHIQETYNIHNGAETKPSRPSITNVI